MEFLISKKAVSEFSLNCTGHLSKIFNKEWEITSAFGNITIFHVASQNAAEREIQHLRYFRKSDRWYCIGTRYLIKIFGNVQEIFVQVLTLFVSMGCKRLLNCSFIVLFIISSGPFFSFELIKMCYIGSSMIVLTSQNAVLDAVFFFVQKLF